MCLGVPFKLISIDGYKGMGTVFDLQKEIDLRLLPQAAVGDYVLVHAGFAIQVIDPEAAEENVVLFQEFLTQTDPGRPGR